MLRDLKSHLNIAPSLAPAVRTASANGAGVDLKGYGAALAIVAVGAIVASGSASFKLQESDDDSSYSDVAAADQVGSFTAPAVADTTERVAYVGRKRYIRVVHTHASGTSVATSASIVRGKPSAAETGL